MQYVGKTLNSLTTTKWEPYDSSFKRTLYKSNFVQVLAHLLLAGT